MVSKKRKSGKMTKSPRKLSKQSPKVKGKKGKINSKNTTVKYVDEDQEIIFDVNAIETDDAEFLSESETNKNHSHSSNNNASKIEDSTEQPDNSEVEDGEMQSSNDDEIEVEKERKDLGSKSSRRSKENLKVVGKATKNADGPKDKGQMTELETVFENDMQLPGFNSEELVNQAVDKTFERFMEEKGLFGNKSNNQDGKEISNSGKNKDEHVGSESEATIYDVAVQPGVPMQERLGNNKEMKDKDTRLRSKTALHRMI